MDSVPISKA